MNFFYAQGLRAGCSPDDINPAEALVGVIITYPAADVHAGAALFVHFHRQVPEDGRHYLRPWSDAVPSDSCAIAVCTRLPKGASYVL